MCGDWLDNLSLVGGYTGYRDWAGVVMTLTAERGLHRVKLNILMLCYKYNAFVFKLQSSCLDIVVVLS